MIEFNADWFERFYPLLKEAFPYAERRDKEEQKALFKHSEYKVYGIVKEDKVVAFLAAWELPSVRFIEHLATDASQRGSGIGKALLQEYMKKSELPILLEVEHPDREIAKRRIHFYERLGFHLYPKLPYVQPSFHGEEPLPLHLMSYPAVFELSRMRQFHKEMYEAVYGERELCF